MKASIFLHSGAFGASKSDSSLETFLREFACRHGDPAEWPEKYGAYFLSDKVIMHPFCWCEKEDCPYCFDSEEGMPTEEMKAKFGMDLNDDGDVKAPNFWYKPLDFKAWWYKYIGRSMHTNKQLSEAEFYRMALDLMNP